MCGIFGIITSEDDAAQKTFNGLADIEYRGYDSWGIAFSKNGQLKTIKEVGFLPKELTLPSASLALGHTRWATHGGVTKANAHPHTDCTGKLALIHNGIVENHLELKKGLARHRFKSETDSEVIVHLLEEEYGKIPDLVKSLSAVFQKLQGLNAIVATDGQNLVACKVGSPLVIGKLSQGFSLASDPNALLPLTNKLIFMEDGQLVKLNSQAESYSLSPFKRVPAKFQAVPWQYSMAKLEKYPHFMLKEIFEQPQVIRNVLQNKEMVQRAGRIIKKAFGTYLIGCGTAGYACSSGVYLFSKIAKMHVNFSIGSEFNYTEHFLTTDSLLVAVSQSGETIDTVEPVMAAKKRGVKVMSLVNVLGSTLYRASDLPVLLQAGPEKAVASTKAMISMLSHMILLAYSVAGKTNEAEKILLESLKEVGSVLARKSKIAKLASQILEVQHIYVLGRGLSYPVALESALKIKEVTYIHAEGFAAGELKHGVIALIEKGTPVIFYVPSDETREAVLSNAMEVKARGAFVIGVGVENNPVFDYFFEVKDTGASSVIPHTVFAQLLAYYLATKKGLNPDKPRNLAKSVVVR